MRDAKYFTKIKKDMSKLKQTIKHDNNIANTGKTLTALSCETKLAYRFLCLAPSNWYKQAKYLYEWVSQFISFVSQVERHIAPCHLSITALI